MLGRDDDKNSAVDVKSSMQGFSLRYILLTHWQPASAWEIKEAS